MFWCPLTYVSGPAKATARILTDVDVLEAHLNQEVSMTLRS